jgi:hypothetical protein
MTTVSMNAQPIGEARADKREQAEGEGGIGRHRDPPAMRGGPTGVEDEIDGDCHRHAANPGEQGQRESSSHTTSSPPSSASCGGARRWSERSCLPFVI